MPVQQSHSWLRYVSAAGLLAFAIWSVASVDILRMHPNLVYLTLVAVVARWLGYRPALLVVAGLGAATAILEFRFPEQSLTFNAVMTIALFATVSLIIAGTARQRSAAVRERERSEERVQLAIEATGLGYFDIDLAHDSTYWSDRLRQIYGVRDDQPASRELFLSLVHPADRKRVHEHAEFCLSPQGDGIYKDEFRLVRSNGDVRWVAAHGRVHHMHTATGKRAGRFVGSIEDVTEERLAREQLEISESRLREQDDRLRALANNLPGAFVYQVLIANDNSRTFLFVSDPVRVLTGVTAAQAMQDPAALYSLVAPEYQEFVLQEEQRCLEEFAPFEAEVEFIVEGARRWFRLASMPRRSGNGVVWDGIATDITEQRRTQDEVRESEQRFRGLFENSAVPMMLAELDGKLLQANAAYQILTGYSLEELRSISTLQLTHPQDLAQAVEEYRRLIRGEVSSFVLEMRYIRKDGNIVWLRAHGTLLRDAEGRPQRIIGVSEDITARRQAAAALRASEERFRTLVEAVPQLVWACRPDGYCDYLSRQWVEYTGIADEREHHGTGWLQAVHPEDRERTVEMWTRAISRQSVYDVEYRLRRYDGEYRWFNARGVIQCDEHGEPSRIFGTSTDIEEQKRSSEALRRTEKLAAAGRLAASMSHEINNPLEGVTNLLFLALNDSNLSQQTREYLQSADAELKRVSQITTQTLRFYRQSTNPSTVACTSVFDSVIGLMRGRIQSRGIRVVEEHGITPDIHCLEGEIRQALLNLVSNAVDAMSLAGGTLRLRSRSCYSHKFGEGVVLTVADTGTGMDARTVSHIFEPFYTTKGIVGTGLGLYVTAEIVRKHGGSIRVRSWQGQQHGTVVSLFVPLRYTDARSELADAELTVASTRLQ